jgi:hypothetical protein
MTMQNQGSKKDQENRWLTGQIAHLPDLSPPDDFTERVMSRISPKKTGFWSRIRLRLTSSMVVITRPLPAAVAATLLISMALAVKSFWISPATQSPVRIPVGPHAKSVSFMLNLPSAKKVAVLGSFNNWSPEHDLMHRNASNGAWKVTIKLQPGRYAYVFMVDDDRIIADPHALWEQDDEFGTRNSIVTIENGNSDENRI